VSPLVRAALSRLAAAIATLAVLSILIFAATAVLPGDLATATLGRDADPKLVTALRKQLHLDRPVVVQYEEWLTRVLHGDLGESPPGSGQKVSTLISEPALNSLILAGVTAAALVPLSLLLGTIAGLRAGRFADHLVTLPSLVLISIPEFVVGTLLILVFGIWLKLLPPVSIVSPGTLPTAHPAVLVLPVLTLLAGSVAQTLRMVRAGVISVNRSEYVQLARLGGIPERRVITHHILPNSLVPAVQVFAFNFQWLVGGIVIVEIVFNYPGIGHELVDAVAFRNMPVVQAAGLLVAAVYLAFNVVADLLVIALTPKLRTAR
jgi:peptide/nickel transport system permease protein